MMMIMMMIMMMNDDDYDYISCHWYLRNLKKNKLPDIMDFLCHRFKFNLFDGYSFYTLKIILIKIILIVFYNSYNDNTIYQDNNHLYHIYLNNTISKQKHTLRNIFCNFCLYNCL